MFQGIQANWQGHVTRSCKSYTHTLIHKPSMVPKYMSHFHLYRKGNPCEGDDCETHQMFPMSQLTLLTYMLQISCSVINTIKIRWETFSTATLSCIQKKTGSAHTMEPLRKHYWKSGSFRFSPAVTKCLHPPPSIGRLWVPPSEDWQNLGAPPPLQRIGRIWVPLPPLIC